MWFVRVCETVALASRLRGRAVCVAAALTTDAAHAHGARGVNRRKEDLRTALARDLRQLRGRFCRVVQPRRRVRLPGRILV